MQDNLEERRDHLPEAVDGQHGEHVKAKVRGVDTERALRCFGGDKGEAAEAFEAFMREGVFTPTQHVIRDTGHEIDAFLREKVQVVIPMYEEGGPEHNFVPREVLSYLMHDCGIPKERILVVNHRSQQAAVLEAMKWGVSVVNAMEVINTCLEPSVRKITGLSKLEVGKGIAILAGLLVVKQWHATGRLDGVEFIMMHDAELIQVGQYNGARYLAYPAVVEPGVFNHILGAQVGRGNEQVQNARVALEAIEHFHPDKAIQSFAKMMRLRMLRLVWMLTGERLIDVETMFNLPLATSYFLETLLDLGIESWNANGSGKGTAQVVIPEARVDGCNGVWAEQFMMNMISRAMHAVVLYGREPYRWKLSDIRKLNEGFEQMGLLPAFPDKSGHVICRAQAADRIIPSIERLWRDMVKRPKLAAIVEKL